MLGLARSRSKVLGLIGVPLIAFACSSPQASEPESRPWDPHGLIPTSGPYVDLIDQTVAEMADLPLSEESIRMHREIFEDGEVSFSEYERAQFGFAACLKAVGLEVLGPVDYTSGGGLLIMLGYDPANNLDVLIMNPPDWDYDPDAERCQGEWLFRVERVWIDQNTPTESEIQAWLEAAWDCAPSRGIVLSDPPQAEDALAAVRAGCEPWMALRDR